MGSIQLQTGKGKMLGLSSAVVDTVEIDETLTISGAAADAKATGDALAEKADKTELIGKAGTGQGAEVFNDYGNNVASGNYAHAEGHMTIGSGLAAHAEGYQSVASGDHTHVEGYGTNAEGDYQHVQGKYNVKDPDGIYAHIVGNGTGDPWRSNAHTLDWDGNAWFAGKVTVGADAEELATKSDVHTARPYVETTLPATLSVNTIYDLGTQTSVTLKLPSANVGNFIQVDFLCGNTPATFTIDAASTAIVSDYDFTPEPDKAYSLFFDYGRLAGSLYGWRFSYAEYTYTEV